MSSHAPGQLNDQQTYLKIGLEVEWAPIFVIWLGWQDLRPLDVSHSMLKQVNKVGESLCALTRLVWPHKHGSIASVCLHIVGA